MALYTQESLEKLRQSIDIVGVIQSYVSLKKQGATYKALCPFHDEKTPSFVVQPAQNSYHCFGCGAHGDAIQFLMQQAGLGFREAIDTLSARFGVPLELTENDDNESFVGKKTLKDALDAACRFFQWALVYTTEGHKALSYLYSRGFDLSFIERFRIGYAPYDEALFLSFMRFSGFSDEVLEQAGLQIERQGKKRAFFQDRITFAVEDAMGSVIGFSARSFKEKTFGGKYINTQETTLFKKSKVLFGMHYSRKRIVKTRHVMLVEGQLDALRMLSHGFDCTVAALGTAFGQGHVKELLQCGVQRAFLLFDSDTAGSKASIKAGNLLQKAGIEVFVAELPLGADPDTLLMQKGPSALVDVCIRAKEYLHFLVYEFGKTTRLDSPAEKNKLIHKISKMVQDWDDEIMIHESLKKLASLVNVPEQLVRTFSTTSRYAPRGTLFSKGQGARREVNPDHILETDLLRWLIIFGPKRAEIIELCRNNLELSDFLLPLSKQIYQYALACCDRGEDIDLIQLVASLNQTDPNQALPDQTQDVELFINTIMRRKVNGEKATKLLIDTVQRIKERNWLQEREFVKMQIHAGEAKDDELLELVKRFDALKGSPPQIVIPEGVLV